MKPIIVAHIISMYLDNFLADLAKGFPFQPLSAVRTNFLNMAEDGKISRIEDFSRRLYDKIKELEIEEDPPYVIEHADGTKEVNREAEIIASEKARQEAAPAPIRVMNGISQLTEDQINQLKSLAICTHNLSGKDSS